MYQLLFLVANTGDSPACVFQANSLCVRNNYLCVYSNNRRFNKVFNFGITETHAMTEPVHQEFSTLYAQYTYIDKNDTSVKLNYALI